MNIDRILLYFFIFIVLYQLFNKNEKMSNEDISKQINEIYKADIGSIRNLSKLANDLTKNGKLIVPGGLEVKGGLTVENDIKSKKNIYWYDGKGKLIANSNDGANIHLDNNHGKRGLDIYANYANKGARIYIKDQNSKLGIDMYNNNINITGTSTQNNANINNLNLNGCNLTKTSGNALRIRSQHGYVDIGPQNGGYTHIYTDRAKYAFNKPLTDVQRSPYQDYSKNNHKHNFSYYDQDVYDNDENRNNHSRTRNGTSGVVRY